MHYPRLRHVDGFEEALVDGHITEDMLHRQVDCGARGRDHTVQRALAGRGGLREVAEDLAT